ncbi:MAG: OmpA family protein [Desulfobacterales bacterium]|nr:MAG: OmpA family protein [Desulfobacterales bacterium]
MKNSEIQQKNAVGWLTTFNDLITLLLVFFVFLFSMGTIDKKKMKDFHYALQSGLGIFKEGKKVSVGIKEKRFVDDMSHMMTQPEGESNSEKRRRMESLIENTINAIDTDSGIRVTYTQQGVNFTFEDTVLFDFGRAEINSEAFLFLDKIAGVVKTLPYPIRVEGHTDNVPIKTKHFPSNWELSIARAVNVVKYLADKCNLNPRRLSAAGYGESKPAIPNTTTANRAKNRRVEIVLIMEGDK